MSDEAYSDGPVAVRPPPPPLRIHHLMLCTVVAALQLALWNHRVPSSFVHQLPPLAIALNAVYEVLGAIGVTLGILTIYWHIKGYAGLVQPGQWLLFSYAIAAIPFYWLTLPLRRVDGAVTLWMANGLSVVIHHVIPCAFFALCAWKIADTLPWRIVFAFIAFTTLLTTSLISSILMRYFNVEIDTAVAIPILAQSSVKLCIESWAVATDVASQRAPFWTHWAGIGLSIIMQMLLILGSLLSLLGWF